LWPWRWFLQSPPRPLTLRSALTYLCQARESSPKRRTHPRAQSVTPPQNRSRCSAASATTSTSITRSVPPDTYRVMTGVGEYTAAYVFTPFASKKWQPFLLAGGGALRFGVGKTYIDTIEVQLGAKSQTSLGLLYGAGTDYRIFSFLGLRLQYRGLVYRSPDFGVPSRFYTGARGHMGEPAVGLVLKF
jgi:opacity protein-like surface antigen